MKHLLAATAAIGLAFSVAPAMAQTEAARSTAMPMSATQQATYDSWPADRRASYEGWPQEAKTYYWSLDDRQKQAWWLLTDQQRVRITRMTPEMKQRTWSSLRTQLADRMEGGSAMANGSDMNDPGMKSSGRGTMQGDPAPGAAGNGSVRFVSQEMVQTMPRASITGEYPLCGAKAKDNCVNPYATGKRGRGVTQPLDQWPGEPASGTKPK